MLIDRVILVIFIIAPIILMGQLPNSNIYHFTFTKAAGTYSLKSPQFLTQFNKDGYNNQPAFFNDDLIYFTTNYYEESQTEIASLDLFEKKLERISFTSESEYSPTLLLNREEFSCVRVEKDNQTQSLRTYPKDGMGFSKRYMNNSDNIAYYAWINSNIIALVLLEEPRHRLAIAEIISERRKIILDNIGRCLKTNRDEMLYFVHKLDEKEWYIKEYNDSTNRLKTICKTLDGIEDFELLIDGSFLSAIGSNLYIFNPKTDDSWKLLSNMSIYGIQNITRICSHKNHLLVVDQ